MDLNKLYLTQNDCYKAYKTHKVKGVMWHSTGANNPFLKRYVGPDDGKLGLNKYNNHWNQPRPGGRSVCVHAFIGKLDNGEVATYQTLPWEIEGWHSGVGSLGAANNANRNGYIGFEICEDNLDDEVYFNQVYKEAVELTAYLFMLFNLKVTDKTLIDHSEGNKLGIASNHADVSHWLRKFGKSMNDVRNDVKKEMGIIPNKIKEPSKKPSNKIAEDGKWGKETTKALQIALGTVADGILSNQNSNSITRALYGGTVEFSNNRKGSLVVKALQKKVGAKVDGKLGPETITKLQMYLGTVRDGRLSRPSLVVKEMQRRINLGTF